MSEKKSVSRMGDLSSLYAVVDGKLVPITEITVEDTPEPESKAK